VGEVTSLELVYDAAIKNFRVPVMVTIEPERVKVVNSQEKLLADDKGHEVLLKWMIEERGLRAQLQSGNLLTGQLMINLGFHPNAEKAGLTHIGDYPVVPTIPGAFERLQENLVQITDKLEKVPFEQIGSDLQALLSEARSSLKNIGALAHNVDTKTAPQLEKTLAALEKTLAEMQGLTGKDSPLVYNAGKTMEELALTLRSLRELATSLELQPQSIIFGKEKETHETKR
jgi:paraquat-inducible protein B